MAEKTNVPGTMRVTEVGADGKVTESVWEIPQDLQDKLEAARKRWAELEEAGTPYWCVHQGRSVSHAAAFWVDDGYDEIHRKHGVLCRDCGGYIQEG